MSMMAIHKPVRPYMAAQRHLMESSYTCLRCVRALHGQTATRSGTKIAQIASGARKLSSKTKSSPPSSQRSILSTVEKDAFRKPWRTASTAAAPAQQEDNFERRVQYPEYGEYRPRVLLGPNDLYHPFSKSPIPEMRERAFYTKKNAYCPHPVHKQTRVPASIDDPEARKVEGAEAEPAARVRFECPDCGIATYCSEEHWADDYESHLEICDTLRQINEDDHDLRSGRYFAEFEYPGPQIEEILPNMTSWDTFLYTRQFEAINQERSMRQATRLLTYPMTIGSVIHELSPYGIRRGGRLTTEGLKSLSALRYTLHPPRAGQGIDVAGLRLSSPPVRIFILGARAESSLPREVWIQLAHLFPRATFHLVFIGPESMANRDAEYPLPDRTPGNPFGAVVEDRLSDKMKITTYVEYFHTLHEANAFFPYDPYFDCFMLYHPGLGHPASSHEWEETLPQLLETKVPIICSGYTDWDMKRDIDWVEQRCKGEYDILMEPGENRFRSLRWDLNDLDPQDISCGNWGVWAFRGKRYEATNKDLE